jgi:protein-disulfide isomerase
MKFAFMVSKTKANLAWRLHRHPSSTLTHEAALAVLKVDASKFWPYSSALFREQTSYFDVNVVNETRNQTYARLAKLGAKVGVDEDAMMKMLKIGDHPGKDGALNTGNGVTEDLKVLVKMARLVGVHVSPTVIVDGVVDNSVSSGWSGEQWGEYLEKLK